jgi:hypothetical protein
MDWLDFPQPTGKKQPMIIGQHRSPNGVTDMKRISPVILTGIIITMVHCSKEPSPYDKKPKEAVKSPAQDITAPATAPSTGPSRLPPAHPPITAHTPKMPPSELKLNPPAGWIAKTPRPMTKNVYSLPKVAPNTEDAEVAVSYFPGMKNIPLQKNIDRWCSQFSQPDGKDTKDVVKKSELTGTKHPTTVIDIPGRYKPSAMMASSTTPKEKYRMLVANINTEKGPWFVKLLGPENTVTNWEKAFLTFVREAK